MLFDVPASAFVPPPKITSTVVDLAMRAAPLPCNGRMLALVTQAAFGQRRKMLRQSLKALGGQFAHAEPMALLAAADIVPTLRAEEVPVEGFVALARAVEAMNPP